VDRDDETAAVDSRAYLEHVLRLAARAQHGIGDELARHQHAITERQTCLIDLGERASNDCGRVSIARHVQRKEV
jgi:hypothetical protein